MKAEKAEKDEKAKEEDEDSKPLQAMLEKMVNENKEDSQKDRNRKTME